jgi:nicotinamide riboside transporter PnuC
MTGSDLFWIAIGLLLSGTIIHFVWREVKTRRSAPEEAGMLKRWDKRADWLEVITTAIVIVVAAGALFYRLFMQTD